MNHQEKIIVVILIAILAGWMWRQNRVAREHLEQRRDAQEQAITARGLPDEPSPTVVPQPEAAPDAVMVMPPRDDAVDAVATPAQPRRPGMAITNNVNDFRVVFNDAGGIDSVTLGAFRSALPFESDPLRFDFSSAAALTIEGVPGAPPREGYSIRPLSDADGVWIEGDLAGGRLRLTRRITIEAPYLLRCEDRFTNLGDAPMVMPTNRVWLGVMQRGQEKTDLLGIDVRPGVPPGKVEHWESRRLPRLFGASGGGCGGGAPANMPATARTTEMIPTEWVAAKDKFFVQVLRASDTADGIHVTATRDTDIRALHIQSVRSALVFNPTILPPGETVERAYSLYVGPKELSRLRALGHQQDEVMQFGFFKWLCKLLVPTLNGFYRMIPNYGVAIILLTLLVRAIFWPLTHRSTESMKKMQELQPQLKELQAKFKQEPQKLQQETWKIYRENKVNPMASCLPMLIQIPVFIALFTVLRSAVELRFAPFLWIRDLSAPENLLAGVLPLPLNILPILMAATMALQQRLTPAAGDPQQQRIMMFMPVMMLFMFYSMPSALVLYWTVSQGVSILQLSKQRRKRPSPSPHAGDGELPVSERTTRQMRRRQQLKKAE